jgi:RNA-directed DNA polymerase
VNTLVTNIARSTGLSVSDVLRVVYNAPYRYKVFEIDKRNGGKRKIAQPARELKIIQRSLIGELLNGLPIHQCATAYRKGKGILQNAQPHLQNTYILKLDFIDFFGSITSDDFRAICLPHFGSLTKEEIQTLINLLFWRDKERPGLRLSIGAPSSPMISNAVLFEFDTKLEKFCTEQKVIYTRYADDMTFSCNEKAPLRNLLTHIEDQLKAVKWPRLELNSKKTILLSKKFSRRVTGIVLSNQGNASIGHEKKRLLRAAIHRFKLGQLTGPDIEKLRGMLAFAKSVEPNFINSMELKYGHQILKQLFSLPNTKGRNPRF